MPKQVTSRPRECDQLDGTVLIVDDDPQQLDFLVKSLQTLLPQVCFVVAGSVPAANNLIKETEIDVLVVDWCLNSHGNDEEGYELLLRLKNIQPHLEVIVITGYAEVCNAVRCVRAGCLDYFSKPIGATDLFPRISQALRLCNSDLRSTWHREALILANWDMVQTSKDTQRKGAYLEWLVKLLMQSVPGWGDIQQNARTKTDEIDLIVVNRADDRFWHSFGSLLLLECKNWNQQVKLPRSEFDAFYMKIKRRGEGVCRLGFFISMSGVTSDFLTAAARKDEGILVVSLDFDDLWNLICSSNRNEWLVKHVCKELAR